MCTLPVDVMKPGLQALSIKKKRRRAKRLQWSRRYRQTAVRRVLHLPTRRTLTYAEAQRFVDVSINGAVSRLDILEPLCIVDGDDSNRKSDSESCAVDSLSQADTESKQRVFNSCRQVHTLPSSATGRAASTLQRPACYYRQAEKTPEELNEEVEYDTDDQVSPSVCLSVCWCFIYYIFCQLQCDN